jgi:ribonuclease BN (tRNA processing enzyme)
VEVRVGDAPVIVLDAGSGIRALGAHLMHAGDDAPVHLFLTHRHSDHVLGLSHFAPLLTESRAITVCCGDGESASIEAFVQSLLSPPLFPYVDGLGRRMQLCEWGGHGARTVGSARVHRFTARHPGAAAVFRVDDTTGPLLAYAPDNELSYHDDSASVSQWRRDFVEFLRGVPVLIHDATYRQDELPRFVGWGHSSATESTRLAMECGAETLVLFHHHPDRDDDTIERMVDEARNQAVQAGTKLRVLAAWEGLGLTV